MSSQLTYSQMSPNWKAVSGLMLAGVALKMAASGVAHSRVVVIPKRPSLVATMIVGALIKDAFSKLGRAV